MASYEQIIADLKKKEYHPVYFLTGEEPWFIDRITDYIARNVLTDEEKTFNQTILYGKDTDIPTIINAAKRFPMMASHQVVIVKEAQELDSIDDLIYYLEKPLHSTLLVINYKYSKLDGRKAVTKALMKHAVFFESKKLYDDKIPDWIGSYLKKKGLGMEPGVGILLCEHIGSDLSKIVNELDKLIITLPQDEKVISIPHIEKYVGISKDYNIFELYKALGVKDVLKANQIINYFGKNQRDNHITMTISSLCSFFSKILIFHSLQDRSRNNVASALKINPYFVSDYERAARSYPPGKCVEIISILREFDLKSKGYGNTTSSAGDLLKEMIYRILH
jgi:DNA polymerase-3 subunit delta